MTGLDLLREEMERRGLNKAQCTSKVAAVVLDILTESDGKYAEMAKEESKESQHLQDLRSEACVLEHKARTYKCNLQELERVYEQIKQKALREQEYIDGFLAALQECETPEGRDAMKRAQVFINSVDVDTKYDNTAFIIALGAILSNGEIGGIEQLQKINQKIQPPSGIHWQRI